MDFHESLEAYDFQLPQELIAQKPAMPRDSSRLMIIDRAKGSWEHRIFRDLPEYLDSRDVLIANNTRVIKARLLGKRILPGDVEGGRVEFVLLEELKPRVWEGLFHASAKYVPGLKFRIPTPDGNGLVGVLVRGSADTSHGTVVAEFDRDPVESGAGTVPLPKYIEPTFFSQHEESYQTVYAKERGSAAAPTAGLHFTEQVIERLRLQKVAWEEITLHVGLGTFRPVKDRDIRRHAIHEERYEIPEPVTSRLNQAKSQGMRIVAVGTTSVRALESAAAVETGSRVIFKAGTGRTSLFIRPGNHSFKAVDRMLTNFHLPKSTLLILAGAFAGRELILSAYEEAIRERYRFFSYGDSMLIL